MQTTHTKHLKQYARVARTFTKLMTNDSNARIKALVSRQS